MSSPRPQRLRRCSRTSRNNLIIILLCYRLEAVAVPDSAAMLQEMEALGTGSATAAVEVEGTAGAVAVEMAAAMEAKAVKAVALRRHNNLGPRIQGRICTGAHRTLIGPPRSDRVRNKACLWISTQGRTRYTGRCPLPILARKHTERGLRERQKAVPSRSHPCGSRWTPQECLRQLTAQAHENLAIGLPRWYGR